MKVDNVYHLEYSDYCLHLDIHNVSADVSIGLSYEFIVKLVSRHGTSNRTIYLIHQGRLYQFF